MAVNEKQKKFVEHYMQNFRPTDAYIHAYGLSNRASASSAASRLLSDVNIIEYMSTIKATEGTIMTPDEIKTKLSEYAELCLERAKDGLYVAGRDFLKAVEALARIHGMNKDKIVVVDSLNDLIAEAYAGELEPTLYDVTPIDDEVQLSDSKALASPITVDVHSAAAEIPPTDVEDSQN
jgi:hypothetical protein